MPIPDFQSLMLPLLRRAAAHDQPTVAELRADLAAEFELSEADLQEALPVGGNLLKNRTGWARTYLHKANLLEIPSPGFVKVTDRGREALADPPDRITIAWLRRYPEFEAWRQTIAAKRSERKKSEDSGPLIVDELSPHEMIEAGYESIRRDVEGELLEQVIQSSPDSFEELVLRLLTALGYGGPFGSAVQTPRSGDGGIDGVINEDKLGLDIVCVQAKRWEGVVGRPVVQAFAGSLEGYRARKGVLMTTSAFSKDARAYVDQIEKRIVLIDGEQLARLMYDTGLGVSTSDTFDLKAIDSAFFEEA